MVCTLLDVFAWALWAESYSKRLRAVFVRPFALSWPDVSISQLKKGLLAQVLDNALAMLHVPYSYGFAIILLTVIVKALTFPLSRKQVRTSACHICRLTSSGLC